MTKQAPRIIWKPWVLNPVWHALIAWGATTLFALMGWFLNDPKGPFVLLILSSMGLVLASTVAAIMVSFATYRTAQHFLARIISLFFAILIVFATLYFWLIVALDPMHPFAGMDTPWHWLGGTNGREWVTSLAITTLVDCLHYSVVTITTLGFGDMHPVHWSSKLLTDVEVLAGFGIVGIALGRFFSRSHASERGK